jgi:hypothetical protein
MKPTSHSASRSKPAGANEFGSHRFPVVDSAYQSITIDGFRENRARSGVASFRNISKNYFKAEARHSFITEATFFAVMFVVSSWPLMQSVRAMTDLVRAFAGL